MAGEFSPDTHWRDSARSARFFIFDAKAAFFLVLFLLHIHLWTFVVTVLAMCFFSFLEHKGFSFQVFLRWLRTQLAGKRKASDPWWKK